MQRILCAVVLSLVASPAFTQPADVSDFVRRHQGEIVREFLELVAIPNHRADLPNIKRNAELLRQMLERRGMKPEVWETPTAPLVYGERLVPGATRTILFYIHFDGQPVDKAGWKQDDPFKPVVRAGSLEEGAPVIADISARESFPDNWRIYARSAGDDKGPIQAFVSAMDAIGGKPTQNIKVILHGEEEGGGPSLDHVDQEPRRQTPLRRADHPRRSPASERQADDLLRRARRRRPRSDGLHGEERDAQRQLRQLAARCQRPAVATDLVDVHAGRQSRDRRLLRRCAAVSGGGGEDDERGAGRQRTRCSSCTGWAPPTAPRRRCRKD